MSLAPSFPSIKIRISPHPSHRLPLRPSTIIRSSKAEGPLRRPAAPSLSPPTPPSSSASSSPLAPPSPAPAQAPLQPVVVTLEYQRRVAKELQDYFKQRKLEEADQGPFFGFLTKNEISNGRWVLGFLCFDLLNSNDKLINSKLMTRNVCAQEFIVSTHILSL
nr:PREDICTED: leiomodin-2-like isoform X1 [Musa acuminata subsp. malaccensis]